MFTQCSGKRIPESSVRYLKIEMSESHGKLEKCLNHPKIKSKKQIKPIFILQLSKFPPTPFYHIEKYIINIILLYY